MDLVADPPQLDLLVQLDHTSALSSAWIPYRREGESTIIVTCDRPTELMVAEAEERLGTPVRVVAATDWDMQQALQSAFRREMLYDASDKLSAEEPSASARVALTTWQKALPVLLAAALAAGLLLDVRLTLIVVLFIANISFASSILFKTLASVNAPIQRARERLGARMLQRWRKDLGVAVDSGGRIPDDELPVYTILIPAFHEANIIAKLLNNIGALDYPLPSSKSCCCWRRMTRKRSRPPRPQPLQRTCRSWWCPEACRKPSPAPAITGWRCPGASSA